VEIAHARKHRRTTGTETVRIQRIVCGCDNFRVIRQAEIIVRTKIDDAVRFATVIYFRARVSAGKEFWLVEFNRPRARPHPGGETWRCFKRVAAFAREKIAQTMFCRIFLHSLWDSSPGRRVPYRGSQFTFGLRRRQGLNATARLGLTGELSGKCSPKTVNLRRNPRDRRDNGDVNGAA